MRPLARKTTPPTDNSYLWRDLRGAGFGEVWHVHQEYQLILVLQARGHRIIGDHIAALAAGDLAFLAPGVPHLWEQRPFDPADTDAVHAVVVQFRESFAGDGLFRSPEAAGVRDLFARAKLGIEVQGRTREIAAQKIQALGRATGFGRIVGLLDILDLLARSNDVVSLCSPGFMLAPAASDTGRIERVCQMMLERLAEPISRSQLAREVNMSEGGFSRYFKKRTGRTVPDYLNHLRIGRACRLLTEEELSVTDVAMACGYENLSNFNRQFRRLKKLSPSEYRRVWQAKRAN